MNVIRQGVLSSPVCGAWLDREPASGRTLAGAPDTALRGFRNEQSCSAYEATPSAE